VTAAPRRAIVGAVDTRTRIAGRRLVVATVIVLQLGFVVRGYTSDHREFAFQMFDESTDWRADIVRVTHDGRRVPIDDDWSGYRWNGLVNTRGLWDPQTKHHADAGIDNQLAFLDSALDYVATHTPRDTETQYLEATVTYWRNAHDPEVVVLRSTDRDAAR
jgi:hypothetical protein